MRKKSFLDNKNTSFIRKKIKFTFVTGSKIYEPRLHVALTFDTDLAKGNTSKTFSIGFPSVFLILIDISNLPIMFFFFRKRIFIIG